jgi:type I restriction enzyme S subunit
MGKYQGYEKYKDSGIEWLGDIPEHWDIWKLTHGFKNIGSGTTPKSDNSVFYDGDIPWITTSELRESVIENTAQKVTKEALKNYSALKIYPKGSVAIAMYGATIGRLGILGIDATVNQACCVFSESENFHLPFFYYWLWMHRPNLISLSSGGGQPNLSQEDLKQLRLPTPPLDEQEKIARFLDYKTKQIDDLIAKKETLIEKLEEKRTALISHAVTKGLDPNVPMKDSGIEWLGEIPEHWNICKVKNLATTITKGTTPSTEGQTFTESGIRYLKAENIFNNKIILEPEFFISKETDNILKRSRLKAKDILFVIAGATIGKTAIVYEDYIPANTNQAVSLIRPNNRVLPEFLHLWLQSDYTENILKTFSVQSAQPNISMEKLGEILVFLSPLNEQKQIAQYLDQKTSEIEEQKSKIQQAIELLKEYRTALITNAVTGKIDVRQIPIP